MRIVSNSMTRHTMKTTTKTITIIITIIIHVQTSRTLMYKKVSLLYRGVLYVEVIFSKECNWYTRCCPLNAIECPL